MTSFSHFFFESSIIANVIIYLPDKIQRRTLLGSRKLNVKKTLDVIKGTKKQHYWDSESEKFLEKLLKIARLTNKKYPLGSKIRNNL